MAENRFLAWHCEVLLTISSICVPWDALGSLSYLRSRSSASRVGFCCAFSGVGWEACSCSSRSLWISCKISLRREEGNKKPGSVNFPGIQDLTSEQIRATRAKKGSSYVSSRTVTRPIMFIRRWLWLVGCCGLEDADLISIHPKWRFCSISLEPSRWLFFPGLTNLSSK